MSLNGEELCEGPGACGHPRREHVRRAKGSRTACQHKLGNGRATCACNRFKGVRDGSSVSKSSMKVVTG